MDISLSGISSAATVAGIVVMIYQLGQTRRSMTEEFEYNFVERYQQIAARIDLPVLLEEATADLDDPKVLRAFYDYLELCEEQLYYRSHGRVSRRTWHSWWYGISTNLSNPSFERAFSRLVPNPLASDESRRFWLLPEAFEARRQASTYEPPRRFQRPASQTEAAALIAESVD